MKSISLKFLAAVIAALGLSGGAWGQAIDYTGGRADLTFYYEDSSDSWDVVFRSSSPHVTGLTSQANQDRFGSAATDFQFDTLQVRMQQPEQVALNGREYWVSPILSLNPDSPDPDLGFRTRLRNSEGEDQFTSVALSLNLANSSMPEGAQFALFAPGSLGEILIRFETAEGITTADWEVWGHSHWHWGFSELGDYSLAFDIQGEFADGSFSSMGSTLVGFQVIPEPATYALLGLGCVGLLWVRRRQS